MNVFILGLNHQATPLNLREHFAFAKDQIPALLAHFKEAGMVEELVIVSTCNRCEFYGVGGDVQKLTEAVCAFAKVDPQAVQDSWYLHYNESALRHLLRVTVGLDSMILGEPEIFGQIKAAYDIATAHYAVAKNLHQLFQFAFHAGKKVRTQTEIGKHPVSIAFAAVKLAKHIFSRLSQCTLVMIGAGETIELAAKHFFDQGAKHFIFVNRTLTRAQYLANQYQGDAYALEDLALVITKADIIVTATEKKIPFIDESLFARNIHAKRHSKTLLMLDLSVPRNIASELGDIADYYLYTIDDLQSIVLDNMEQRKQAAYVANALIDQEVENYFARPRLSLDEAHLHAFEQALQQTFRAFYKVNKMNEHSLDFDQCFSPLIKKIKHQALIFAKNALKNDS